jgi:hypothetical protein
MTVAKKTQVNPAFSHQKIGDTYLRYSKLCFASAGGIGLLTLTITPYAYTKIALVVVGAFVVFAVIFALMLLTAGFFCRAYGLLLKQPSNLHTKAGSVFGIVKNGTE